jgi:hypothetical protein
MRPYSKTAFEIRNIAGTGSQTYQVLDPFINNQGAHGRSWGVLDSDKKAESGGTDKKAPGEPPKIRSN